MAASDDLHRTLSWRQSCRHRKLPTTELPKAAAEQNCVILAMDCADFNRKTQVGIAAPECALGSDEGEGLNLGDRDAGRHSIDALPNNI